MLHAVCVGSCLCSVMLSHEYFEWSQQLLTGCWLVGPRRPTTERMVSAVMKVENRRFFVTCNSCKRSGVVCSAWFFCSVIPPETARGKLAAFLFLLRSNIVTPCKACVLYERALVLLEQVSRLADASSLAVRSPATAGGAAAVAATGADGMVLVFCMRSMGR